MLNKIAIVCLFFIRMLSFPNTTSSGQTDNIEKQLQRAHQRLAIRHIELRQFDPRSPRQAYLQRFYEMNRGPYEVEVDVYSNQP